MSSFFTTPASQRKRKRQEAPSTSAKRRTIAPHAKRGPAKPSRADDEASISGSDASDNGSAAGSRAASESDSDDEAQTAADRRLKLAERYLENVKADVAEEEKRFEGGFNAQDIDQDLIAARLKEDVAEDKGRVYRRVVDTLDFSKANHTMFRADTQATTGVSISHPFAYTVSKDMSLIKWRLVPPPWSEEFEAAASQGKTQPRRRKPKQVAFTRGSKKGIGKKDYQHHTAAILCVAASFDGRFVATGGRDRRLIVWDARTLKPLKIFYQHRDAVTSVAFRGKTNQLFSASKDRTIKIWSLNEMAYVETLFGHQDEVLDVAAVGGSQERCVSVGARDRTARLWKVVEESQLVFRGGAMSKVATPESVNGEEAQKTTRVVEGSLDRVIQLDTQLFVTGSDNGTLSLFALHKKKPMHILAAAHGFDPIMKPEDSSAEVEPAKQKISAPPTPRPITAMACVPYSDLFLTGSWDGQVRTWRLSEDQKRIESAGTIDDGQIRGIVNDLAVIQRGNRGNDGVCIVAGVGTEPRNGRWLNKTGKNCAHLYEIPPVQVNAKINGEP